MVLQMVQKIADMPVRECRSQGRDRQAYREAIFLSSWTASRGRACLLSNVRICDLMKQHKIQHTAGEHDHD